MKRLLLLSVVCINIAICSDIAEITQRAGEIAKGSTAAVTYQLKGEFTFDKPHILDDYDGKTVSPRTIDSDDAVVLVGILDKEKALLVVRMAKGTLDKGAESELLVKGIVERFRKVGYKRIVVLENRGFGILINFDTANEN